MRGRTRLPSLPQLLNRKLYKTGQTRGADDDQIYQNRVSRNSTVLIPYGSWEACKPSRNCVNYERGFIVLLTPLEYFCGSAIETELDAKGLAIGTNALVFYETRHDWNTHNPDRLTWTPATSRTAPLGGEYVGRIPATTATIEGGRIVRGFTTTSMKGAGIRVYEYATAELIAKCRDQLEALFWLCNDAFSVVEANGMSLADAQTRRAAVLKRCEDAGLIIRSKLIEAGVVNGDGRTICPLCREELSAYGFFNRMEQAKGRAVPDLTVTEINLFHVEELQVSTLNHRPYNIAWGHHHCNVVVRDAGIHETLQWMHRVLERNKRDGQFSHANNPG